eukprot:352386-Chlamydomonas_euryale.AAC.11
MGPNVQRSGVVLRTSAAPHSDRSSSDLSALRHSSSASRTRAAEVWSPGTAIRSTLRRDSAAPHTPPPPRHAPPTAASARNRDARHTDDAASDASSDTPSSAGLRRSRAQRHVVRRSWRGVRRSDGGDVRCRASHRLAGWQVGRLGHGADTAAVAAGTAAAVQGKAATGVVHGVADTGIVHGAAATGIAPPPAPLRGRYARCEVLATSAGELSASSSSGASGMPVLSGDAWPALCTRSCR